MPDPLVHVHEHPLHYTFKRARTRTHIHMKPANWKIAPADRSDGIKPQGRQWVGRAAILGAATRAIRPADLRAQFPPAEYTRRATPGFYDHRWKCWRWNPCFSLSDNLVILYENTPQILEPCRLFKWQVIDADV